MQHPTHPTIKEFTSFLLATFADTNLVGAADDHPREHGALFVDMGLSLQWWRHENRGSVNKPKRCPTIAEMEDYFSQFPPETRVVLDEDIPENSDEGYVSLSTFLTEWREKNGDEEEAEALEDEITFTVSKAEHSMILAGLRLYQASDRGDENINDIASDGDTHEPLTDDEIDELCIRIN